MTIHYDPRAMEAKRLRAMRALVQAPTKALTVSRAALYLTRAAVFGFTLGALCALAFAL